MIGLKLLPSQKPALRGLMSDIGGFITNCAERASTISCIPYGNGETR